MNLAALVHDRYPRWLEEKEARRLSPWTNLHTMITTYVMPLSIPRKPRGRKLAAITGGCLLGATGAGVLVFRKAIYSQYILATRFERLGANGQGYCEYRHVATGIVFIRLPGGTFWMGSTDEDLKRLSEEIPRRGREARVLDDAFSSRPEASERDPVANTAGPDPRGEEGDQFGRVARGGGTRNPLLRSTSPLPSS